MNLMKLRKNQTVYFAGSDLLTCATDDMYQGEILSYAQADNAIDAEGSSWVNIDIETLLAANPDYVFIEAGSLSADDFKMMQEYRNFKPYKMIMFMYSLVRLKHGIHHRFQVV